MSLRDAILRALAPAGAEGLTEAKLRAAVKSDELDSDTLHSLIESMATTGAIIRLPSKNIVNPAALHWVVGRLSVTMKGTGFVIPDDTDQEDLMIPAGNLLTAVDGDRVAAQPIGRRRGRDAGAIVTVLERRHTRVVGQYLRATRSHGRIVPKAKRLSRTIEVPLLPREKARDGDWVIAEIKNWSPDPDPLWGEVIEVLGEENSPDIDLPIILEQHGINPEWPDAVMREVEQIPLEISEETIQKRRDLRKDVILTIDPETAKDFDDALSIEVLGGGTWLLGVHIADVAEHVVPRTALDDEARERGTSIYPVDKVIPMLPERLSNHICSLRPQEDKLAMSVFMEIDRSGRFVGEPEMCESIICSASRLTYAQAQRFFDNALQEQDFEVVHPVERELTALRDVAKALAKMRHGRGALDMDLPEPQLVLNDKREVVDIKEYPRWESHRLVEQCMLAANEAVAVFFARRELHSVYRNHDEPDGERLMGLIPALRGLGVKGAVPHRRPKPSDYQAFLEKTRELRGSQVVHRLLLRTLALAKYDTENRGHFGLASDCYTHFTSPIRRYPDLLVHRLLKKVLRGESQPQGPALEAHEEELAALSLLSSNRERRAERVERDVTKLKTLQYLEPRLGQTMKGIVSSVTARGLWIELEGIPVEGFVTIDTLPEDWYVFDDELLMLIGERTGAKFRLAQRVDVTLISIDTIALELSLVIAGSEKPAPAKGKGKGKGSGGRPPWGTKRDGGKHTRGSKSGGKPKGKKGKRRR